MTSKQQNERTASERIPATTKVGIIGIGWLWILITIFKNVQRLLQIRVIYKRNLVYFVPNLGISEIHFPMSPLFSPLDTEPRQDLA